MLAHQGRLTAADRAPPRGICVIFAPSSDLLKKVYERPAHILKRPALPPLESSPPGGPPPLCLPSSSVHRWRDLAVDQMKRWRTGGRLDLGSIVRCPNDRRQCYCGLKDRPPPQRLPSAQRGPRRPPQSVQLLFEADQSHAQCDPASTNCRRLPLPRRRRPGGAPSNLLQPRSPLEGGLRFQWGRQEVSSEPPPRLGKRRLDDIDWKRVTS